MGAEPPPPEKKVSLPLDKFLTTSLKGIVVNQAFNFSTKGLLEMLSTIS